MLGGRPDSVPIFAGNEPKELDSLAERIGLAHLRHPADLIKTIQATRLPINLPMLQFVSPDF